MSRDLPPARTGGPAGAPHALFAFARKLLATLLATLLIAAFGQAAAAHADDEAERDAVNAQINQANADLDEQNAALSAAVDKAAQTHSALTAAQNVLATAQSERAQAQAADQAAATALRTAQAELTKAEADVKQGLDNLSAERKRAGNIALSQFRGQGQLASWAAVIAAKNSSQVADRVQWNDQMMAQHNQAMSDLETAQQQYEATEATKAKAQTDAETAKQSAATALSAKQTAENNAAAAATALSAAAKADDGAQAAAAKAVADEKVRLATLETQRNDVEQRIHARLAAEKAAAEKAAAEKAAADKAAADQAAAAAAAAAQQGQPAPAAAAPADSSGSPFIWPVNGALTSPFGMRMHPVVHIWVLHDGQDFGADCGTPIKAAAAGTVVENYWDTTGFGNRLLVDHGIINGTAYTTGYNHAESYIVSVGQHVEQGQILGYVGTTGYSTGCHLHLNLYVNGKVVDPMPYLP